MFRANTLKSDRFLNIYCRSLDEGITNGWKIYWDIWTLRSGKQTVIRKQKCVKLLFQFSSFTRTLVANKVSSLLRSETLFHSVLSRKACFSYLFLLFKPSCVNLVLFMCGTQTQLLFFLICNKNWHYKWIYCRLKVMLRTNISLWFLDVFLKLWVINQWWSCRILSWPIPGYWTKLFCKEFWQIVTPQNTVVVHHSPHSGPRGPSTFASYADRQLSTDSIFRRSCQREIWCPAGSHFLRPASAVRGALTARRGRNVDFIWPPGATAQSVGENTCVRRLEERRHNKRKNRVESANFCWRETGHRQVGVLPHSLHCCQRFLTTQPFFVWFPRTT